MDAERNYETGPAGFVAASLRDTAQQILAGVQSTVYMAVRLFV